MLPHELKSIYFEVNAAELSSKRRHDYSCDRRPECPQLIALVVTPEGLPLAHEVSLERSRVNRLRH